MSEAGSDKKKIATIARLVAAEHELLAKLAEVHEELVAVLGGGPTIGARMRQVEIAWRAAWSSRYHGDYQFNRKNDPGHMKRLLRSFSPATLQVRMISYIQSDEPFYVERKHAFPIFVTAINDLADAREPVDAMRSPAPADCTHRPKCTSDKEHTDRRRQDRADLR